MFMSSDRRGRRAFSFVAVTSALLGLLGSLALTTPALAADGEEDPLAFVDVQLTKSVDKTLVLPGETITYTLDVNCRSIDVDCINIVIDDTIPAPFVLQDVVLDSVASETILDPTDPNKFTVRYLQNLQGNMLGLNAGTITSFTVTALLPEDVSADYDGATVKNTAYAILDNVGSNVDDDVDVVLSVPLTLSATAGKSFAQTAQASVPGLENSFTITGTNTANAGVDAMVLEDATPGAFTDLAVTGASLVGSMPAGADRVTTDWLIDGVWIAGEPASDIALPDDPSTLEGLRFTFSSSTGETIARNASASILVNVAQRASVSTITSSRVLTNTVHVWVVRDDQSSDPNAVAATKSATLTLTKTNVSPVASKSFSTNSVVGGNLVTVTLGASNGGTFTLDSMTITEPQTGELTLQQQGLAFEGFVADDVAWPVGATQASIRYLFAGETDFADPVSTLIEDTIPGPAPGDEGKVIIGFSVTFTGAMLQGQYATVPFSAATSAVLADVTSTNVIRVDVHTTNGLSASATAQDDLTSRTARINTTVRKTATPSEIYSIAGAYTVVSLPARIDGLPVDADDAGGSTVGAATLSVTDSDPAFFDYFNVSRILPTTVPAGTTLTVWTLGADNEWVVFDTKTATSSAVSYSRALTATEQNDTAGLRFVFTPNGSSATLAPGFNVQPNLRAVLRATLRSDSGTPAANPDALDTVFVSNTALSNATSPSAPSVEDDDTAVVALKPVPSGPGGIDLIAKRWVEETVDARTAEHATTVISWGTANLEFETVTIADTDSATPGQSYASTVYEAFDLAEIMPITSSMDPQLEYDAITGVQLFSLSQDEWVDTASNPCAGGACDGTFPGYVLTDAERADTVGVRLVFEESPSREDSNDITAPLAGSGVAASIELDREIHLDWVIRDVRRSNSDIPVLGTSRQAFYNAADTGLVINSAGIAAEATDGTIRTDSAQDSIQILDQPLNVEATKVWEGGPLGNLDAGTPARLYPTSRLTLTAKNTSLARVDQLSLTEPSPTLATVNPFEYLNLTDIVSVDVPSGPAAVVLLQPGDRSYTVAEAEALEADDLDDVTSISVTLDGTVANGDTITLIVDAQLRKDTRTEHTAVPEGQLDNTVQAQIVDPGGTELIEPGTNAIVSDYDDKSIEIQHFEYGVLAGKTLIANTTANESTPAVQYADTTLATVRLSGQPSGNVRSTQMIIEDTDASFWNAYDFSAFPALTFAKPIDRVRVDVLVGIEYAVDGDNNITWSCPTEPAVSCWKIGTSSSTPQLPAGVQPDEVRGIRFTFTQQGYATWERPFNPKQVVDFVVERRDQLVTPVDMNVPSTIWTDTVKAPGEDVIGTYNNTATVEVNSAQSADDVEPIWRRSDDASSAITFQHLPAEVSIIKSEYGPQSLGVNIPFDLIVKNTGGTHDSPLTGVVVVDTLPSDGAGGTMLVVPTDPDTGETLAPSAVFSYSMLNSSNVAVSAPSVTAVYDDPAHPTTITFTLNQTLPLGWTLVIHSPLAFRDRLGAEVHAENSVVVTADQPFDECRGALDTFPTAVEFEVFDCSASTTVWPLPSAPMSIVKSVRGVEAGPLDADGVPLTDENGDPFDDLGVVNTTAGVTDTEPCATPNTRIPGRTEYFYRAPCAPITRPGAEEEWAARFTNNGNIGIKQLVAIDVLPTPNDQGVVIASARSSKWAAKLTSYPEVTGAPSDMTYDVWYTDEANVATADCNAADIQLDMGMTRSSTPGILGDCLNADGTALATPRAWKLLPPSTPDNDPLLATVVALKFNIRLASPMTEDSAIAVIYRTRTANQQAILESAASLYRDSIAYNSIAGSAVGTYIDSNSVQRNLPFRYVTEPRKVGVALATGQIDLAKLVTGSGKSYATTSFALNLACVTTNDEAVTIGSRNPFTVTAGTALPVLAIPLYSTCEVTEPGNYGATTVTPSGPVRVIEQLKRTPGPGVTASTISDPHPAWEVRTPPLTAQVTNDYPAATLTLTKSVTTNGALDKNGDPVVYKPALASVNCTFDNGTGAKNILSKTDVELVDGTTITYPDLVAGALCTIVETDQRGATTTSVVNTVPSTGGASPAQFALQPGSNSVAVANDFGAGSLRVTKVIDGSARNASWATGPFTIQVVCTNPNTTVTEVFNRQIVLSSTTTTYLIEHLPTGSSCVTTEPEKNGATSTTLPGTIVINRAEQTATVTNTFNYASLNVKKTVTSSAVDGSGTAVKPGPFDFTVVCTFTRGTTASPIVDTVVNETFQLSHNGTRDFTQLPANSRCVITEGTPVGSPTTTIKTTTTSGTSTVTALTATIASLTSDAAGVGTNFALVTNTYAVGSLKITKSLKGGASTQFGAGQTFSFLVTCTAPGVTATYTKTVSRVGAGTITVANIIAGSTCSVSESNFASTGANAHVIRNNSSVVFDGTGIAIVGSTTTNVTFENWYLTGAITVTKSVTGPGAAFGNATFTVHLECTRGGNAITIAGGADRTITDGTSIQYTLLPSGATCVLTESGTGGATSTVISGASDTDSVDSSYTFVVAVSNSSLTDNQAQSPATVTNRFELASLDVSKTVVSSALHEDGTPVTYGDFSVQVTCLFQGNPVKATGFASNTMTFTLDGILSRTLTGLPAGAVCTIAETNDRGAARTTIETVSGNGSPVQSASVTLVQDGTENAPTNFATITNEFDSGSLELSKIVDGDAREQYGVGTFPISVVCTLVDGADSQVVWTDEYEFVDGDAPIVLSPIATGSSCVVTEQDIAGATSTTITIDGESTAGTTATATIPADETTAVVVTNTFDYASLTVSKTVVSDAVDHNDDPVYPGGSFTIEVECTSLVGETVVAFGYLSSPMVLTLGHLGSTTLTGLPAGASCVIDETDSVGADSTTIETATADESGISGSPATISYLTSDSAGEATNSASITNSYGVTSFTVTKVLKGAGAEQFAAAEFDIAVLCIAPGDITAYDKTVTLPDGDKWYALIDGIPNGSVCTTEELDFDSTGADAQKTVDAEGTEVTSTTVTSTEPGAVFIENWYLTGELDVTKLVTGLGGPDGDRTFGAGPFTVHLECVRDDIAVTIPNDGDLSFVDGETVTYSNLPRGASCTLTETNVAGAHSSAILDDSDATLTTDVAEGYTFVVGVNNELLEDNQPQPALTVANDFPLTSITITKTVITAAVDDENTAIDYGPFDVEVTCTFEDVAVYATGYDAGSPMSSSVADAGSWELAGLPVGAECLIVESGAMGADETSITTTVDGVENVLDGTEATITLATDGKNLVDIDNTFDVGTLVLSKQVVIAEGSTWGNESFTFDLECTLTDASGGPRPTYSGSWSIAGGDEPITVDNLAAGSVCDLTESKTGAANSTTITVGDGEPTDGTSAEFTIPAETLAVQVTNTFDLTSIEITKERNGSGWELWGNGPFEVTVVCTRDVDGATQVLDPIPGGDKRELVAPDYSAEFTGLPVGANCSIVESKVGGANGFTVSPGTFTLESDPTAVVVSNVFKAGALRVTKQVTGDGVGVELWGTGPFEVSLECKRSVNGVVETIEIPGGATRPLDFDHGYVATYDSLPEGANCVVTETVTGEATSTVVSPGAIAIVGDDTVDVTVTNTFTIGQLQIVKTASQPVVQADDEFDYTFEVTNTGTVPAAGVTVVDEIPDELKVIDISSDDWTDCAIADTDTFGYGGVLTCVYDETLPAGAKATPFTITVAVHPDVAVDQIDNVAVVTSTTRGVKGDDDDETVLVKWLVVGAASECQVGAPWMTYEVNAHNVDTAGKTLTVTWSDSNGTAVKTEEIPLDGGPISGKLLWPGAEVNAEGVGTMWPGWRAALPGETPEFENLVLDPTLPEYALRADTEVTFSINPSASVVVTYPEATAECDDVTRDPGLWVKKVASTTVVPAGGTFDYTITAGNDGLGSVSDVAMVDVVPSSLKVLSVTPAAAESPEVPAWESCEVTKRLPNGFGGTVTCLLDRPLGYLDPVPAVVLGVQLDASTAPGSVVNVARLTGTSTMGQVSLSSEDAATILTPGMLALTGFVVGGIALPLALGLLTLGGVLIAVRVAPKLRSRRRH